MERTKVLGSKREQIYRILKLAGWYENREINIVKAERYYKSNKIDMYDSMKAFFREFYGIADSWYIKVDNPDHAADFEFILFPDYEDYLDIRDYMFDDAEYKIFSQEYKDVYSYAKEEFALIGIIGYYYPARVWMGKSGKVYATHEYDDGVKEFSSIFELIEDELDGIEIDTVMVVKS